MPQKNPVWTRARFGRNRVHWVAYDDRVGAEGCQVVAQGYATSLVQADAAARAALAEAGMYRSRRMSKGSGLSRGNGAKTRPSARPADRGSSRPREYLYTRHLGENGDGPFVAAHLILKKTARKVYVTERSCGPDQLGTGDESWEPGERAIALDRARLERDGATFSARYRHSDFYASREEAAAELSRPEHDALGVLGLRAPCTLEDIKEAYRRRALEVHPDRGGSPGDFHAVEDAYRQLLREALSSEA